MPLEYSLDNLEKQASKLEGIENHLPPIDLGGFWEIDNYNVSNLVIWFSNLTRYGTNFKKINNAGSLILDDESQYREAMTAYGVMAGILAISLSVFLIVFCCCNCMFRSSATSRTPKYKGQKRSRSSCFCGIVIFLIAIAGAATFTVGIVGEIRLHNGANKVCETVNNVSNKTKSIHDETKKINKELEIDKQLDELEQPIKEVEKLAALLNDPEMTEQLKVISSNYEGIKKQIQQAKEKIVKNLNNELLDKMQGYIDQTKEECPKVTKYLRLSSLLVLIVLAISSLLFILGLFNNCFRSIVVILEYLFLNILIVFGVVSFLTLIVGSDFCMHSKPLVKKHADTPVLDYYLYCNVTPPNSVTPPTFEQNFLVDIENAMQVPDFNTSNLDLNQIFNDVKEYVNIAKNNAQTFNSTLSMLDSNIEDLCGKYIQNHPVPGVNLNQTCKDIKKNVDKLKDVIVGSEGSGTESLLHRMEAVSESVSKIINTVECKSLSTEIDGSLTNLCTNIYEAFFFFLMNSFSAVLCFYVMLIFTVWMLF